MLARAPRTSAELQGHLTGLGYQPATAAATVARCAELGWIDDARFAADRAAQLRARGAGSLKISADLEHHGVPPALIDFAVSGSLAGEREAVWARRALEQARVSEPRRAWRLLAGRGFPEDVVNDVVGDPEP